MGSDKRRHSHCSDNQGWQRQFVECMRQSCVDRNGCSAPGSSHNEWMAAMLMWPSMRCVYDTPIASLCSFDTLDDYLYE